VDCPYLISIGDNCLLGQDAFISGNIHSGGDSRFGLVVIEANATIGARCMVFPNVRIGKGATLMVGSVVPEGTVIPEGETWRGNPARKWLGNPQSPAG
jgi:acetyltransferase-like isoleucine patch superfamily enzyme